MSGMQITVENEALIAALNTLGEAVEAFTRPAAKVTADNIAAEALRRVARATGETARGITVSESRTGRGYVVESDNPRMPELPIWLEFGTKQGKPRSHSSAARPYLFISASLESGAHDRRMREAVQAGIAAKGFGS